MPPPLPTTPFYSHNNVPTTFRISFVFGRIDPIDYLVGFWLILVMTLNLNFQGQIFCMQYLCPERMVPLSRIEKQMYWYSNWPQMWPWSLTLAITLTLKFSRSNILICFISEKKLVQLPRNEKQTYQLNTKPHMCPSDWPWPWPWPWVFKLNVLYPISQKQMVWCLKTLKPKSQQWQWYPMANSVSQI